MERLETQVFEYYNDEVQVHLVVDFKLFLELNFADIAVQACTQSQGVVVVNLVMLNLVVNTSMPVEIVVLRALGVADGVMADTFSGRFIYNN